MFWFLYFVLPELIVAAVILTAIWADKTGHGDFFWAVCAVASTVVLLGYFVGVGCIVTVRHYDKAECHSYAKQTGRPTRFVKMPGWGHECFTKAHDGKWIPKSQIGDYNK